MVVIHEMIPHHHYDMAEFEFFIQQHHNNKQVNDNKTGADNHFPFPAHHHVSASEGFFVARMDSRLEIKEYFSLASYLLISDYLLNIAETEPPEVILYSENLISHKSFPFIISPNAMRGSPSVA
jgi:hypothetical protein